MTEKRWLFFALGVMTVISLGAVTNQLVPLEPATGLELSDTGITFPDGTVQTTAAPSDQRRLFYLTDTAHKGGPDAAAGPLDACGPGFHMASLWELADVGTLSYAYASSRAWISGDSGKGPPAAIWGWIRTGTYTTATGTSIPGVANCNAWTANDTLNGTIASLPDEWNDPAQGGLSVLVWGLPWVARVLPCGLEAQVWCVEDYPGSAGSV